MAENFEGRRRRVIVIYNPAAGRSRRGRLNAVIDALRHLDCDLELRETNAPGHAEQIAREIDPHTVDILVAAGGDGTVNEVVNGLRGKSVALAVIPLGTANVLADEVGLSRNPTKVATVIAQGPLRPIRVGCANGRRFVMMAGAGFDAEVVDGVRLDLKKLIGPLAYVWEMIRQAFTYRFNGCDLEIDGRAFHAVSAIVCRGRFYGGPFVAAPKASIEDDSFQVAMFGRRGWFNVTRYGLALIAGRLPYLPDVHIVTGRRLVLASSEGAPLQADGDILTRLPACIEIDAEPVLMAFPA